jgi:hypothetical protein
MSISEVPFVIKSEAEGKKRKNCENPMGKNVFNPNFYMRYITAL